LPGPGSPGGMHAASALKSATSATDLSHHYMDYGGGGGGLHSQHGLHTQEGMYYNPALYQVGVSRTEPRRSTTQRAHSLPIVPLFPVCLSASMCLCTVHNVHLYPTSCCPLSSGFYRKEHRGGGGPPHRVHRVLALSAF
jgi:hypothetical protein